MGNNIPLFILSYPNNDLTFINEASEYGQHCKLIHINNLTLDNEASQ